MKPVCPGGTLKAQHTGSHARIGTTQGRWYRGFEDAKPKPANARRKTQALGDTLNSKRG